jgi:hypothetical protein
MRGYFSRQETRSSYLPTFREICKSTFDSFSTPFNIGFYSATPDSFPFQYVFCKPNKMLKRCVFVTPERTLSRVLKIPLRSRNYLKREMDFFVCNYAFFIVVENSYNKWNIRLKSGATTCDLWH